MTIMKIKKHHRYLKANLHSSDVVPKHTHARSRLVFFPRSFRIGVILNKEALKRRSVEVSLSVCYFLHVHSNRRRKEVFLSKADETGNQSFLDWFA